MAIINKIKMTQEPVYPSRQTLTECEGCVEGGYLKLTTFGSKERKSYRKQSQNVTFSPRVLKQLREIMDRYDLGK